LVHCHKVKQYHQDQQSMLREMDHQARQGGLPVVEYLDEAEWKKWLAKCWMPQDGVAHLGDDDYP
jgi:hypothetical protein